MTPKTISASCSEPKLSASDKIFLACVSINRPRDGSVEFTCKRGLFSVAGRASCEKTVEREARHYFAQYLSDGEYTALLKANGWTVEG